MGKRVLEEKLMLEQWNNRWSTGHCDGLPQMEPHRSRSSGSPQSSPLWTLGKGKWEASDHQRNTVWPISFFLIFSEAYVISQKNFFLFPNFTHYWDFIAAFFCIISFSRRFFNPDGLLLYSYISLSFSCLHNFALLYKKIYT